MADLDIYNESSFRYIPLVILNNVIRSKKLRKIVDSQWNVVENMSKFIGRYGFAECPAIDIGK